MSTLLVEGLEELLANLPTLVTMGESLFSMFGNKTATVAQKTAVVVGIAAQVLPNVAASLATQPASVDHLTSVVNSAVAAAHGVNDVVASAGLAAPVSPADGVAAAISTAASVFVSAFDKQQQAGSS